MNNSIFTDFLRSHINEVKTIPLRRHNMNVLESKHGVIQTNFLCLMGDFSANSQLCALQAVRISNNLYKSDILSCYEMAKGSAGPARSWPGFLQVDQEIMDAQYQIEAIRKRTDV